MKKLEEASYTLTKLEPELAALENLLLTKQNLDEIADISPVFKNKCNLCTFLLSLFPELASPDRYAHEFKIFGDFAADICVGSWTTETFLLVELEDAQPNSVFESCGRAKPCFGRSLEKGFSQLVDWFCKIDDMRSTSDFEDLFGTRSAKFHGLPLVGRENSIVKAERKRLAWRADRIHVNSQKMEILTYDTAAMALRKKLEHFKTITM
jgi:hypothetical protein